jgi:drug/metabolite transporter (DMT)-like permease
MFFAAEAGINVGLITVIWSVNPLLMAFADYVINKQHLKSYHYVGLISIAICTVIITLLGGGGAPKAEIKLTEVKAKCATWVPVLFGVITPCMFCTNGMFTKKILSPEIGFDASNISFSAFGVVNVLVLCAAIPYWINVSFNQYLLWVGGVGAIINTLGLVCIQNALKLGPAGPVSAIAATSTVLLVIIEAAKHARMISVYEGIGLIFGVYGALILVIPEKFECCYPCWSKHLEPADTEEDLLNKKQNDQK